MRTERFQATMLQQEDGVDIPEAIPRVANVFLSKRRHTGSVYVCEGQWRGASVRFRQHLQNQENFPHDFSSVRHCSKNMRKHHISF